ncbi:MAG TPA: hypothetical protein DCL61_13105 [Cyanobacteria bacterium UBA12227]|nr:hypothetical protein [Cyanobacteria bacterium UBA12227]HAX86045.1 hypothetical protein [Cyanobacteria bacterium UBA11370]HBY76570.1 hypothetical protein [Cyanobacteria bacterium UBA11148]
MSVVVNSSRINPSFNSHFKSQVISYGRISVDMDSCQVTYDGTIVPLLPKEYSLLLFFLKYPNHVLSYEALIEGIWEFDKCPTHSSIRSHIKGLRKAFKKADARAEAIIETVHGVGYRLKLLPKDKLINSLISPSLSLMTGLLQAKGLEYLVINEEFIIKSISPGLENYCDYPETLKLGIQATEAFPEFVGFEKFFKSILTKECNNLIVKAIARAANPHRPAYINFYVMTDDSTFLDEQEDKLLFVFFEDASEQMLYKQRLVQLENEFYLTREV